jgi:hypothetical protein
VDQEPSRGGDGFSQSGHTLGFEIECWILDHNYFPASINQRLLETLANPLVNLELNCEPLPLNGDVLRSCRDGVIALKLRNVIIR